MELDNELKGAGNSYTTEFRQYDPRLGRWLSLDPLSAKFPWQSPFVAFDNNPICLTDPKGAAASNGESNEGQQPAGAPSEPKNGDLYEDKKSGTTWEWKDASNDSDAGWVVREGMLREFTCYPEAKKAEFKKEHDRLHKNRNSIMGQFFRSTFDPNAIGVVGPDRIAEHPEWQKARDNADAATNIVIGNGAIGLAPLAVSTAVAAAPSAFGIASDFTLKTFAFKAGTSAVVQGIVNDGKINLIGVVSDGALGFGSSAIISSSADLNLSVKSASFDFTSIGNGISPNKFLYNSSVNLLFGAKGDFLSSQMKAGGANPFLSDGLSNTLYQFSSNGLSKAYDKK
jgi:RHS repeat-associated protein